MQKYTLARALAGKKLITTDGEELGRLIDFNVSEASGRIESAIVEPNPESGAANKLKKDEGYIVVPYSSITAVGDFIIVDRRVGSSI